MSLLLGLDSYFSEENITNLSKEILGHAIETEQKKEILSPNVTQIEGYTHKIEENGDHVITEELPQESKSKKKPKEVKLTADEWNKQWDSLLVWLIGVDPKTGGNPSKDSKKTDYMLLNFYTIDQINGFGEMKIKVSQVKFEKKDKDKKDSENICTVTFDINILGGEHLLGDLQLYTIAGNEARIIMLKDLSNRSAFTRKVTFSKDTSDSTKVSEKDEDEEEKESSETSNETKLPGYTYKMDSSGVHTITEIQKQKTKIKPKVITVSQSDWEKGKQELRDWIGSLPNADGTIEKTSFLLNYYTAEELNKYPKAIIKIKKVVFSETPSKKNANVKINTCKFNFLIDFEDFEQAEVDLELSSIAGNEARILQMIELEGEVISRCPTVTISTPEISEEAKEEMEKIEKENEENAIQAAKEQEEQFKAMLTLDPADARSLQLRQMISGFKDMKAELKNINESAGNIAQRLSMNPAMSVVTTASGPGQYQMGPIEGRNNLKDTKDAIKNSCEKVNNIIEKNRFDYFSAFIPSLKTLLDIVTKLLGLADKAISLI